ncbi:MAG: BON domain-containing protein [Kaiparowitsia implicata GSE-PSE-MK54-09C]|jgi:osmotically-inducible protein OsmY|nr:BON domain-containing protein [Kaiparowitsia implicata GSE-PSE-MK54-09C]
MGWLSRLFPGSKKKEDSKTAPAATAAAKSTAKAAPAASEAEIPPERVGLDGEYDDSGLAKRVALAFDDDSTLEDLGRLWVAQTSSKVVLKGEVPSQDYLNKAISVARSVDGATEVDASQVKIMAQG